MEESLFNKMIKTAWEEWHSGQEFKDNIPNAVNPCFSAGYRAGIKDISVDISLLVNEMSRAEKVYPDWPKDMVYQASIMNEEAGEVVQAVNNFVMHNKGSIKDIHDELIQTGAMVLRCLKNLDVNNK